MDKSESDIIAGLFLTGQRMPGDVREVTFFYRWISVGKLYAVYDWKSDRVFLVAAYGGKEVPVRLNRNPGALSEFLSRQFKGRSQPEDLREIWRLLKDVAVGPSAVIATSEFREKEERDGLGAWLKGREKDPTVFENLCTGIRVSTRENEWGVQFNVFNPRGGVDMVKASGSVSPFTVQVIAAEEVKPAGEFSFPLVD